MTVTSERMSAASAPARKMGDSASVAELVDVILDKGIVIDAWARVPVFGLEILTVEARVVVASIDTYADARFVAPTVQTDVPQYRAQGARRLPALRLVAAISQKQMAASAAHDVAAEEWALGCQTRPTTTSRHGALWLN